MRKIIIISAAVCLLVPSHAASYGFGNGGVETHVGGGSALFAPWHHRTIGFGYDLSVVMRPSYARYLFDELEKWNLGLAILSTNQRINSQTSFRDVSLSVRYYTNRGKFGPHWQSGFIGAGAGIATAVWDYPGSSNRVKDNSYIIEAGYEIDLDIPVDCPLVLMFAVNCRIIDLDGASYSGLGAGLTLSYGVGD